jgi:ATPase family associated with various cellular activities (AAA)
MSGDIHLDKVLRREIFAHVARNLGSTIATGGNLILAINGRPGSGKTFHCKTILGSLGVSIVRFAHADLESDGAGVPGRKLTEAYLKCSADISDGTPTILLLEDIDLGLGSNRSGPSEVVQYTMNRNLLTGVLMGLCDSPRYVQVPRESSSPDSGRSRVCERVPIIMTGNNLASLYPALLRDGRSRFLDWAPSEDFLVRSVGRLFPGLDAREIGNLLNDFSNQEIGFWSAVQIESSHKQSVQSMDAFLEQGDVELSDLVEFWEQAKSPVVDFSLVHEVASSIRRMRTRIGEQV